VYVTPSARGKGVFAALYQRVLDEAKAHHVADVYLYVDEHNTSAQAVCEKLGMERSHYRMYEKHV
jgi:GNAT superfamily N-acetyltransferase